MLPLRVKHVSLLLALFVTTGTAAADDYAIDWWTVDGGGEMFTTGGEFELSGTIGQPDAGVAMTGGSFGQTLARTNTGGNA